jgi:predicted amidophosphoribosyltransferase
MRRTTTRPSPRSLTSFPADTLVHALKFRSQLALAPLLGDLLLKCIPAGEKADCVLPVPLSKERLRERGYNQAAEIARHVASARSTARRSPRSMTS